MTHDVKAAAERVRSRGSFGNSSIEDRNTLVAAYLAMVPADDDELLTSEGTEAWLLSVGFIADEPNHFFNGYRVKFRDCPWDQRWGDLQITVSNSEKLGRTCHATIAMGGGWEGPFKTRGDVRRLCAALGVALPIPLKEGA